jgi:hypothetical protein
MCVCRPIRALGAAVDQPAVEDEFELTTDELTRLGTPLLPSVLCDVSLGRAEGGRRPAACTRA